MSEAPSSSPLAAIAGVTLVIHQHVATVTLNRQVFADIGITPGQARALVSSIETLRRHAGDF